METGGLGIPSFQPSCQEEQEYRRVIDGQKDNKVDVIEGLTNQQTDGNSRGRQYEGWPNN